MLTTCLQNIESENQKILEIQNKGSSSFAKDEKDDADARSVFVGNVDFSVSADDLSKHFEACGHIYRVTILKDRQGNPKGFGYIEFKDESAVSLAMNLTGSTLSGRQIKVEQKRSNLPSFMIRGGRGRGRGFRPRRSRGYRGYTPYQK